MKKLLKNSKMLQSNELIDYIKQLGFDIVGFSNVIELEDYKKRIAYKQMKNTLYPRSNMSSNDYIAVNKLVANAKTIISLGMSYHQKPATHVAGLNGYYTKSSYGVDYHSIIYPKLSEIIIKLQSFYEDIAYFVSCDTKIVDDRYFAYLCGNGFVGKNTMIINEKYGSEVFYATIIIDKDIEFKQPQTIESKCNECNRCVDACPTNSLTNYYINYQTCLSYLTQSKRMIQPLKLRSNIYGCDICNNVCPYNKLVTKQELFKNDDGYTNLIELLKMSNSEYRSAFSKKSLFWLNKNIVKKNAVIALANYLSSEQIKKIKDDMIINSKLIEEAFDFVIEGGSMDVEL